MTGFGEIGIVRAGTLDFTPFTNQFKFIMDDKFNPTPPFQVEKTSTSLLQIREQGRLSIFTMRYNYLYEKQKMWTKGKRLHFLDSVFRQSYISPIVLRRIDNSNQLEVLDGWQRITTILDFFRATRTESQTGLRIPKSLRNTLEFSNYIPEDYSDEYDGSNTLQTGFYVDLPVPMQEYINNLTIDTHIISGIGNLPSDKVRVIFSYL